MIVYAYQVIHVVTFRHFPMGVSIAKERLVRI